MKPGSNRAKWFPESGIFVWFLLNSFNLAGSDTFDLIEDTAYATLGPPRTIRLIEEKAYANGLCR